MTNFFSPGLSGVTTANSSLNLLRPLTRHGCRCVFVRPSPTVLTIPGLRPHTGDTSSSSFLRSHGLVTFPLYLHYPRPHPSVHVCQLEMNHPPAFWNLSTRYTSQLKSKLSEGEHRSNSYRHPLRPSGDVTVSVPYKFWSSFTTDVFDNPFKSYERSTRRGQSRRRETVLEHRVSPGVKDEPYHYWDTDVCPTTPTPSTIIFP